MRTGLSRYEATAMPTHNLEKDLSRNLFIIIRLQFVPIFTGSKNAETRRHFFPVIAVSRNLHEAIFAGEVDPIGCQDSSQSSD